MQQYLDFGYRIIPLHERSKKPIHREWPQMEVTERNISALWGNTRRNVGLICDGITVVDFDTGMDKARSWYREHRDILKTVTLTRRGIHAWFRSSGEERHGRHADGELRCEGKGYVVVPDSIVETEDGEWQYRFVDGHGLLPPGELPLFRREFVEWPQTCPNVKKGISDIRAYLSKIESVQENYGSKGLVRAAARCRDAGLSEADTMAELVIWNSGPTVSPPWSPEELARAVNNVFRKAEQ